MYYPEEVVEEVRSRADIVDIVGHYVQLKKKGSNYFGLCPFHGEKTASFSVNPRMQIFHCFGCGKGGDAIKFLMEIENITFPEALQKLAEQEGVKLPEYHMSAEDRAKRDIKTKLLEINKKAAVFYYNALRSPNGKKGLDYLKNRALSDETIRQWGLGYAGDSKDTLYQLLLKDGYTEEDLRASGLFNFTEHGIYDKFFNRVIFPIMDANNRVIGFGGRVIGDGEPKYLNSPETELFNKSRNLFGLCYAKKSRKDAFILCEGYMDVISMHQAGFTNAVASLGTALTEEQCRLLTRYVKTIYLTYDSDGAGVNAAKRAMPMLRAVGINTKRIESKPYKDPDEFIKKMGAAEFQDRIDNARNSFLWLMDTEKANYDLSDPAGMTDYTNYIADRLSDIPEALERENYLKAVAREQMINEEELRKLVNRLGQEKLEKKNVFAKKVYMQTNYADRPARGQGYANAGERYAGGDADGGIGGANGAGAGYSVGSGRPRKKRETALMKSEKQLITWLQSKPGIVDTVKNIIKPEDFSDETTSKVLSMVYEGKTTNQIMDAFRDSDAEYEYVTAMFTGNLVADDADEETFRRALTDVIRNIKGAALNRQLEAETDPAVLTKLFSEQSALQSFSLPENL